MKLTLDEGTFLVKLARSTVNQYMAYGRKPEITKDIPKKFLEKRGVFVTVKKISADEDGVLRRSLRGCIGYPQPTNRLVDAVIDATLHAATRDPRFPPMSQSELKQSIFEVSVLTKPQLITVEKPFEYPDHVVVGRDGLIVESGLFKGLLLPQVSVEYDWDAETFLTQTCLKAGLVPDAWTMKDVKIYKFQAQIFAELAPDGEIIEMRIYFED